MPSAWEAFHAAAQILAGPESQRARLARAYAEQLAYLGKKDIPKEIRDDFLKVMNLTLCAGGPDKRAIMEGLSAMGDAEITGAINTIIRMYDTVTRYEPILAATDIHRLIDLAPDEQAMP